MVMTDGEICRNYKAAKDKEQQIEILADLNLVGKKEIREILTKNGMEVPEYTKRRRRRAEAMSLTDETEIKDIVLPDIAIEALTEKYHEMIRFRDEFTEKAKAFEEQAELLRPFLKGGKA